MRLTHRVRRWKERIALRISDPDRAGYGGSMPYLVTFLEGMITFISPCVLPMIPVYVLYFTGGEEESGRLGRTLLRALAFVLGFTLLFVALGVFAASLGAMLVRYQRVVNLITGAVVVLLGLHYAGIMRIGFLERTVKVRARLKASGVVSCLLLGVVFAVGWSPCTGTFLGSAMMLAASQSGMREGMLLLVCYSLGLGVPFICCALLIDQLKGAFAVIKRHYRAINLACGVFLMAVGVMMMAGWMTRLTAWLA